MVVHFFKGQVDPSDYLWNKIEVLFDRDSAQDLCYFNASEFLGVQRVRDRYYVLKGVNQRINLKVDVNFNVTMLPIVVDSSTR